jgi:hypothetical protein
MYEEVKVNWSSNVSQLKGRRDVLNPAAAPISLSP